MITYGSTTLTSYNTITKIEVYYYKSTSATSLSGGSWSTTKPTWENGKYIWQKIRTTYEGKLENGQYYSESDPVNITGQQGQQGVAGTSAYSYKLTASDTIVTISKTGVYSTNSITFSATSKQGTDNVTAYSGRFKIETTSDGITWTTRYPTSGTGVDESSTTFTIPANISNIRCSLYQTGGMTVLLDITSVSIVQDGTDGIDGTSENLLMDVYAPSLTKIKAPWNRYISNASYTTITTEFIEEANLPDPNATHFLRITDSSASNYGRGLCFYSNGTPPFINGHTYKIGCWVRKHAGEPKINAVLGSIPGGFHSKNVSNTDWEWIEWVRTFGETDGTINTHNSTYKRLYFYFYNNNVEGSSLDMCGFRLENVQTDISTARNLLLKTEKLTDWGITNGAVISDGIVTIPEVTANTVRGIYSTKNFDYELIRNQTAIFSVRVKAKADEICACNLCIGLVSAEDSTAIQKYNNNYVHFTGTGNWQTICIATPINDEFFASGDGTVDYDNCWAAVKIESLETYHNGFQVKEPQFSLGTSATAWSPAPEDVNENIQQVQDNLDNLEIGGRNLILDTAIERISSASADNSAYVMPAPMMSDYASGILNNRDDYFTYSFDYEVTGNEASNAYIYVQIRGGSVPSTSDGYYSYVLENPTGKYCCTFKLTKAQATGTYKGCGIRLKNATDGAIVRAWNIKLEKGTRATDWSPAPEDIDANIQQVQNNLDNLEIGGRNLLRTEPKKYVPTDYSAYEFTLTEPLEANQTYTIHLWNIDVSHSAKTEDQLGISVYYCGGTVKFGTWQGTDYFTNGHADHLILTFTPTEDDINHSNVVNATTKFIRLYNSYPNTSGTRNMSIEKWKLEKGSKATDWSPAPEDTQAEINTALSQSIWYATCDTAGDVLIKEATIIPAIDNFTLNIGTTVNVKFENANSGDRNSLKLNVNNTGDKDIRYMNNATMVAIPSNGYIIAGGTYLFVYDGTYWIIQNLNYNTNDNYYDRRQHKNNITAVTAITAKHLIVGTSAGYKQITSTSGGSLEFDLGYPILWAYSAIEATKTSTATYEAYPSVNFSTSGAIQDGEANKMLWLKGTIRGNTFTLASANFLTTRIPTSEDGMYYIPLGIMVSATTGYFSSSNRIYAYVDDAFQPLDNAAALTAIQARSEIVQTQETLSLQIRDISIGGANLFEKTKAFEGIANNNNTHDALTEFVYKDLTVRYANTVTFNNSVVELSAYQFTNLTSDTWYTFSFYAKGNADIGFMYAGSGNAVIDDISVSWDDNTYTGFNTTSTSSNIIWLTPTDKWQRYSVIFHVEEQDITALHRLIGLYARPISDNVELITETKDILRTESGTDVHFIMEGNEISICGYKLELGNKPTDWTPSDKDKAGYDNIISQINLSQEGIAIRADKIRFEGMITANEGFSIDEYGNMTANNGTFNGVFESYATEINENTFDLSINNGHIHFYNNDRTLTDDARHVGYIGGIRNSVSYISGEEKINDAIIIRLDNDCDFIIDSQETSGTERVLRVTNHSNNYISVDYWKDLHVYLGKKIQMYGYENNQYPEIIFKRYISDTNQYITRGTLALHSATGTSDINDRLYLYAKNQGNDLAGDQYLYFAGKGLKYSSSGQSLRTGYVATHKYIATQQFSITDQTITKGSSQNFEIDVTRDGYTPIMCTVTATSGTGAFYLSIYHWTIIGDTVKIFTHNNSTTTDAANITIWVNVLYKLTY